MTSRKKNGMRQQILICGLQQVSMFKTCPHSVDGARDKVALALHGQPCSWRLIVFFVCALKAEGKETQ